MTGHDANWEARVARLEIELAAALARAEKAERAFLRRTTEREAARARAEKAEASANEQTATIAYWSNATVVAVTRAEQAESDRDRAINEAHAAREARRMTEAALETMKEQRDRARQQLRVLRLDASPRSAGWFDIALADEPPKEST